jgi:hypothetical protein
MHNLFKFEVGLFAKSLLIGASILVIPPLTRLVSLIGEAAQHWQGPIHGAGSRAGFVEFRFKLSTHWLGIGLSTSGVVETTTAAEQQH